MRNRIVSLMNRIARLEQSQIEKTSAKKLMMSSVTYNAIPDQKKLVGFVKKQSTRWIKAKKMGSICRAFRHPMQTVIVCKHNDVANSRYEQEVLTIHHSGTANRSSRVKVEVTSGSQRYVQSNLGTALSFLVKVADAERQELMEARQLGVEASMIRPEYAFSGRSSMKMAIPSSIVVPDLNRLSKAVASLLKDKEKSRKKWASADSAHNASSKSSLLSFNSNTGDSVTVEVFWAGTQGAGSKFSFTVLGRTTSSLNIVASHIVAELS